MKEKWKSLDREKMFQKMKKSNKKKWMILALVLIGAIAVIIFLMCRNKPDIAVMSQVSDVEVTYGDITTTITGSATIQPKDQYSVTSLVTGEVLSCTFEEGGVVKEGDVLYQIDAADMEKSLESAELNLQRAQRDYQNAVDGVNDLRVLSDASGLVSQVHVSKGDRIQEGTPLADVYDASYMKLTLPFNASDIGRIYVGQGALVQVYHTSEILTGTVSEIRTASYAKAGGALVQDVVIKVKNPGVLTPEDTATATVGEVACNDSGTFEYLSKSTITSTGSGKIETLYLAKGNNVKVGDLAAVLSSESANQSLENSALSLRDAELSSEKAQEQLEDYTITAPISGTVVEKNVKAGDKLDHSSANATGAMAVIFDMSSLQFDLHVDELDINKMKVGQEVLVTAEALDGREYQGTVTKVSVNGTTTNGVTVYPITVEITEFDEELLPGMNVDVSITVSNTEHVLVVPIGAVNRGNTVYVKGEKESKEDQAPQGYKTVQVTTGASNEELIEITSGLKKGDLVRAEIVIPINEGFMMPGMNGGRMQGGGMPDGGMQGGGVRP